MSKDKITGGRADKMQPEDFCPEKLKAGTDHEMEHTNDRSKAREIAMDHLAEDENYYEKLKDMEKQDRIDMEADGKRELDYGSEDLEKEKDIKKKWKKLKKALDSDKAIMDMAEAQEEDDEEQPEEDPEATPEDGGEEAPEDGQQEQPEEVAPEEQPEEGEEGEEDPHEVEQRLIQALKDEGHSDSEIAYIVHGHTPHSPDEDEFGAQNEQMSGEQGRGNDQRDSDMDASHKQRMNDLEYDKAKSDVSDPETENNHKSRMLDVEYESAKKDIQAGDMDIDHKKRMLDLEYEKAKQEMEIELENKKKEADLKLRHAEDNAKHKLSMQRDQNKFKSEEAKKSRVQDAGKTSKKETKGK